MNGLVAYWEVPLYGYTGQLSSYYVKFIMLSVLTSLFESFATSITTDAVGIYHGPLDGDTAFKYTV